MKEFEHGGNIHKILREKQPSGKRVIDFSANINPLGPPEWLRPIISSQLEHLVHYPDPDYRDFTGAVSRYADVPPELVVTGNGTTELLYVLMQVIDRSRLIVPVPSYVDYVRAARLSGIETLPFVIEESRGFELDCDRLSAQLEKDDAVIIATPNNPTGINVAPDRLLQLAVDNPETLFIIDEAFLDFAGHGLSLAGKGNNVVTLNSMTKFFGVPGLRVGYGVFPEEIAVRLRAVIAPWTVNTFAQAFGARALDDRGYQEKTRNLCSRLRENFREELGSIPRLQVFPGTANYLFVKILAGGDSDELSRYCLEHNILIRKCDNYQGLEDGSRFIRLAVRSEEENETLLPVLKSFFGQRTRPAQKPRRKGSIMFQGTCSDAGKSIISTAFCRIFLQDGLKVAPFKAQNMSLNSFVTLAGDEMGRAQVVQAQAARLDPDCRMNPVLLKPNSDTGSQIIVCGKAVGNMSVVEYNRYKPEIWQSVCRSYDELADQFDVVVLEGAGSPGEVNLKADDIVNMRMARYAGSPVILVGDIDRGGVYSSFVGIMEVLAEWERQLVAGFLVNKFRGQASLLDSAHRYVKDHTGREVVGVVPYLRDLGLPEEDSVSFKKGSFNKKAEREGIDIVLVNLPHISNFTDIEPFLEEPDVSIRVVDRAAELGQPDVIILPGSKNVIHDLQFLKNRGFAETIADAIITCRPEVVGICGGYQMLGRTIEDPYNIESEQGDIEGLAYLDLVTVIEKDKNLKRKSGRHLPSGHPVHGYEIHHGVSTVDHPPVIEFSDGSGCGSSDGSGRIWGSYLHGIFDADIFRRWFIDEKRKQKGLAPIGQVVAPYDLEEAFDRLAECVRSEVDLDRIYKLMNL